MNEILSTRRSFGIKKKAKGGSLLKPSPSYATAFTKVPDPWSSGDENKPELNPMLLLTQSTNYSD